MHNARFNKKSAPKVPPIEDEKLVPLEEVKRKEVTYHCDENSVPYNLEQNLSLSLTSMTKKFKLSS